MKTTLQILEEALVLVTDGWCQGDWAHDINGIDVPPESSEASYFCPEGAIIRAGGSNPTHSCGSLDSNFDAMTRLKEAIATEQCIPVWNDHFGRKQDEVIEAFKTAIAVEKRWLRLPI